MDPTPIKKDEDDGNETSNDSSLVYISDSDQEEEEKNDKVERRESDSDSDDSNHSNLSFEFTAENCDKRIDEFVEVTKTNSALAQFFLQDRSWNVARSVSDYFSEMRKKEKAKRKFFVLARNSSSSEDGDDEGEESPRKKSIVTSKSIDSDEKKFIPSTSTAHIVEQTDESSTSLPPELFRHITWNIDGISPKNLELRTRAICDIILKEKASFVFLQEVVDESEKIIRQKLATKFTIFSSQVGFAADYYTLTLVAKKSWLSVESHRIIDYPLTSMGRTLLEVMVTMGRCKLCLLNTHLESTKEGEEARVHQLNRFLKHIVAVDKTRTVLAGGDLNLRDKDLVSVGGLPINVSDTWQVSGRRAECEFTWDLVRNDNLQFQPSGRSNFKPRCRFDRLYLRQSSPAQIDIVHFGLIGLERLKPHVCFPSDHWGISSVYKIFEKDQ